MFSFVMVCLILFVGVSRGQETVSGTSCDQRSGDVDVLAELRQLQRTVQLVLQKMEQQAADIIATIRDNCTKNTGGVTPCTPNPCQNSGQCCTSRNSYTCACATGFTGTNCEAYSCITRLIQQNTDGSNFFNRTWAEFKVGFGTVNGNYWLGNELLHQLTKDDRYKLRFDLQSADNSQWYWAEYSTFIVGNESSGYLLQVGGFSGNVLDDAVSDPNRYSINGMKFTTKDRDNDQRGGNCALDNGGGFWYSSCSYCGVNAERNRGDYFSWDYLYAGSERLQTSRMSLICR